MGGGVIPAILGYRGWVLGYRGSEALNATGEFYGVAHGCSPFENRLCRKIGDL